MEFNEIYNIVAELLAVGVLALVGWAVPKVCEYFNIKNSEAVTQEILNLVGVFVKASEQLLKEEDPNGEKRKQYVIERLEELGYEVTESILAMIESKVFEVNVLKEKVGE